MKKNSLIACGRCRAFGVIFDLEGTKKKLSDLSDRMGRDPQFWQQSQEASKTLREQKALENTLKRASELKALKEDLEAAAELISEDPAFLQEAVDMLALFEQQLSSLELEILLSAPLDDHDAYLTIQAGAGGTESCDWASMLWRMYERFCQKMAWQMEMMAVSAGDAAGVRSVECKVSGERAYGHLKAENGVHRLIRISPFDSGARRHTSFASVQVSAAVDEAIEVQIHTKDLRIDTYRSSGAGGQHVNKTDSAVRITHEPTGIVVQSQSQRSQHQNREQCMQMLRSKLYQWQQRKQEEEREQSSAEKSAISFGSQIRTYTLHPFKLVKDHRTSYETSAASAVLDGDLSDFIKSFIAYEKNQHKSEC